MHSPQSHELDNNFCIERIEPHEKKIELIQFNRTRTI